MLHLEHLNLVVNDINESLAFYRAAFPHWRVRQEGTSEWFGKARRWLHFGDDYQYLTLNDNGEGSSRDPSGHQPGVAHFAFVTENLDALISRLATAGFVVDKQGAGESYRRNVYYFDPNGFEVEFVEYLSDIPAERNHSNELKQEAAA